MKRTIDNYEFRQAFEDMGRGNQFSDGGLDALFGFLEDYERETGEEMELDVIGLCCDFVEYESIAEFNANYGTEYDDYDDICETMVIAVDDESFIIQAY